MKKYDDFDLDLKKNSSNGNTVKGTPSVIISAVTSSIITGCTGNCTNICSKKCSKGNGCTKTCTCDMTKISICG